MRLRALISPNSAATRSNPKNPTRPQLQRPHEDENFGERVQSFHGRTLSEPLE